MQCITFCLPHAALTLPPGSVDNALIPWHLLQQHQGQRQLEQELEEQQWQRQQDCQLTLLKVRNLCG